jgi:hypothetical protein
VTLKYNFMITHKKYLLILPITLLSFANARSQTIAQLVEQLSLDVQKLTQLKTILSDMYKDYEVIDKGYTDIRNIAAGNFNLHKAFLDGLLLVSPAVRDYPRIIDILNAEYSIVTEYQAANNRFRADPHFTLSELNYLSDTYNALFQRSLKSIDELTMVTTDDQLRMSDSQRLQAIDRVYSEITAQLGFLRHFNNNTTIQAIQRAKAANDIGTLKSIYGITQ